MSIIISAQSLKNKGTADIQTDGVFSQQPVTSLNTLYGNINFQKFKKQGNSGIEYQMVKDTSINPLYIFNINDETDNSSIIIQAKLTELSNINLDTFEKNSGRTISAEKKKSLENTIDLIRDSLHKVIISQT